MSAEDLISIRASAVDSLLTRWRKRIGEAGVERLLSESIDAARRGKVVKEKSFDKVIVDTTVMGKPLPTRPTVICWRKDASTWSGWPNL